jgi:ABC-type multidrug transport system ATPase subunit
MLMRCAGPSGAGKSTLLNALACRLDKGATMDGKVRLNNKLYELNHLKRLSSYVMQDDLLNAHHTVEETLLYAAKVCVIGGKEKDVPQGKGQCVTAGATCAALLQAATS